MKNIASSMIERVGKTPLVEMGKLAKKHGAQATILAKVEACNPGGSVKDRIALAMLEDAEANGQLKAGGRIIEPTSGNTGIGLAWIAAAKGYSLTIVMPDTMSIERRQLLQALGAELILTPGARGMSGAIGKAKELVETTPNAITLGQFDNPANPAIHKRTTAEEIWNDTEGQVDVFIAGVGTGGTISGVGEGLKAHNPAVKIMAVEPAASPVLSGGKAGAHKIQGIGAGFIPKVYNANVVDEIITIENEEAFSWTRELAQTEGLLAGISSGAALAAAMQVAGRAEYAEKTIVVLLPDTGERYLSIGLFQEKGN